jgi:electron-transferring-flavoprotein dehydrogenase
MSERESMDFDVVIVGAGPCGLSASIRLQQLAAEAGQELSVCVVEKGSEVGAHILSGAVMEPTALDELLPDWRDNGPEATPVNSDQFRWLLGAEKSIAVPHAFVPSATRNDGNYIVSLGNVCRWLGDVAEGLAVNIFPGFAASEVLYDGDRVCGVATGDMGISQEGEQKDAYTPGYELRAPYTIFAEGCRGSLGKSLMTRHDLRKYADPQHYGIGLKEVWSVDPARHRPGAVLHTLGWPLSNDTEGGGFVYHAAGGEVYLGLIIALGYSNPHLNPFQEFQRWKHHPVVAEVLEGGKRVSYGARAVNKGGFQSLPRLTFPGGLLAGCEAGFLNGAKIKGTHTAMKTGMLAAEELFECLRSDNAPAEPAGYASRVSDSWVHDELHRARNFGPAQHKFGTFFGSAYTFIDQNLLRGRAPWTLSNPHPDHESLKPASESVRIDYPKPDGILSFDRLSSVYLSSTNHEEDQPCHLVLNDPELPVTVNLPRFDEPAQRYCPAGVYEIVEESDGSPRFQINAQNCVHCKTCDIKDPAQNINWVVPEGGGGPNYSGM